MSQRPSALFGARFLSEALPLVASYFSGEQVPLSVTAVDLGDDVDAEALLFSNQIRLRHALACCAELVPLIHRIEGGVSTVSRIVRTETKGAIRGRLDIPRYVARRSTSLSWPKTYPVLVTEESPNTPENALANRVLRNLLSRLNATIAPPKSAEALKAQWYRHWIANRLRRNPWRDVCNSSSPQRLRMETSRRIARRQTGNEYAYADLLQLIDDWRLIGSELGGAVNTDKFTRAFLAFPSDEGFLDRIFEIWCLRELASALARLGAHLVDGPQPLTVNRSAPIYTFLLEGKQVEIWFQKSLPKEHARWAYDIAGQPLRGIPDITVIADGIHYLLVDAKNRNVQRGTRPEETYKILGYFENFRSLLDNATNWAILSFVSYNGFAQQLTSIGGRKLLLTSAHPMTHDECSFSSQIDSGLVAWINTWNPSA